MLNSSVRAKKPWWGLLGLALGLVHFPATDADAASVSTLFAFDLHVPSSTVVEGSGSNQGFLFGTTYDTSLSYGGAIYKVPVSGGAPEIVYQLQSTDGYAPQSPLLRSTDGYLYGTTRYWPRIGAQTAAGTGTIFRIAQDGTGYTTLHTFAAIDHIDATTGAAINTDGFYPDQALIEDGTYLYGVTPSGGDYGMGTVFRIRKSDNTFEAIYSFPLPDDTTAGTNSAGIGNQPAAALTLGSDGRLYGVTRNGGLYAKTSGVTGVSVSSVGTGTIFALDKDGNNFESLHSFSALDDTDTGSGTNSDGVQPQGSLLEVNPGIFIGTTSDGGMPIDTTYTSRGAGTIFEYNVATNVLTTLYNFDLANGSAPLGQLILGTDRLVYGTTIGGAAGSSPVTSYGVIYSLDPAAPADTGFSQVHAMTFAEGGGITGGVIQASDGDLYGVSTYGNACTEINGNGYGAVFRYSLTTNASVTGYANCTPLRTNSGGGSMSPGTLWLLGILGLAPPVRRRLFGVQ